MATNFEIADQLLAAGDKFAERRDARSLQNANIARDMAHKLAHYGSFASEKQKSFALSLIRQSQALSAPAPEFKILSLQDTWPRIGEMLRPGRLIHTPDLHVSPASTRTHHWIIWNKVVVGLFYPEKSFAKWLIGPQGYKLPDAEMAKVQERMLEFEADPKGTAVRYGRMTGTCCVCGKLLTNKASVEAGIGPICADGF